MTETKTPLKILTIDDNDSFRLTVARYFTLVGGHIVEVAHNGSEGIKKAKELQPDLILLDRNMPDMNGTEVMDHLCGNSFTCDIPVIMITGDLLDENEVADLRTRKNFWKLEGKPADFKQLLEQINSALPTFQNGL